MKTVLLLTITALFVIFIMPACTGSQAEDHNVVEAPGIRITGEAMEAIKNHTDAYNLNYTQRVS